jgi:hypothetical protein
MLPNGKRAGGQIVNVPNVASLREWGGEDAPYGVQVGDRRLTLRWRDILAPLP